MVTVKSYSVRTVAATGRTFITLELEGGLEIAVSSSTGKTYATTKKCSIPTTFDENVAQQLVGTSLTGEIVKQEVEPYEFTNPSTGEVQTLDYTWTYRQEIQAAALSTVSMLKAA
jgi:hypothetical protein